MLDERVRDRIVAETRGNPLALLELPRGLTATQLAGGFGLLGGAGALGTDRGELRPPARARCADDARRLLLVAAAEPIGDPLLLCARPSGSASAVAAVDAAADGLLAIGERVTFRHPLVRSAVYRAAGAQERRAAHLALAEATDREVDPDRRAWHLAAAAAGPTRRSRSSSSARPGRAQARGGLAAAAAFLQRAVALTGDPARRADRALAAAQASLRAGTFDVGARAAGGGRGRPAGRAPARPPGPAARRGRVLREPRQRRSGRCCFAPRKTLEPLDPQLARETYLDAWSAALFAGRLASTASLREVSREARGGPAAGRTSASVRPAAGRLRAGVHRRPRRGGAGAASRRRPASRAAMSRSRRSCAGGGSRPRPP